MFESNLKRIAPFVQKLKQNLEIGPRDPGHAHLGVILWSTRRRGSSSVCTKFEADRALYSFKNYKGGPTILKLGHVSLSHARFEP